MSKLLLHSQGPPQRPLRLLPLRGPAPRREWWSHKDSAMTWTMPSR